MTSNEIRKRLHPMNLKEVSRQTGISHGVLYAFMKGREPKLDTAHKIVQWLESLEIGR